MQKFNLTTTYTPTPDQQRAIDELAENFVSGTKYQTLLGVTGSGKTFTVANLISKTNLPALIISHNKTLAAQLYQEFKSFFPENAVSYFVSYYDYYQPESYIPSTDTYIEKDADINDAIDRLRLAATNNILTRNDTIVVASVSCIYNIGSPNSYENKTLVFSKDVEYNRLEVLDKLIGLQYVRGDFGFHRGTFRVRGENIDIFPAYQETGIKLVFSGNHIQTIFEFDPLTGSKTIEHNNFFLFPAKHFIADPENQKEVFKTIRADLQKRIAELESQGKKLESYRLKQKVNYDLEMISEMGYVKGIENYSRYFDGRKPGDPPYSLIDYYKEKYGKDWLLFIDESHMTFPQIRGMFNGDQSRKQTLIDYGFRLPSALDNRPLKFDEFTQIIPNFIATSATPAGWELTASKTQELPTDYKVQFSKDTKSKFIVEQLLRPTGIPDPEVTIRPLDNQVKESIDEIKKEASKGQRTLVTTLTKKIAEDLTAFLKDDGISVQYLHSDVDTLERTNILDELRRGNYDCIVGVNLLREGLDLPEVSTVLILDADKEGFLRSEVSLIQTMGRAARHVNGKVILFADTITKSIKNALDEVGRRRVYQIAMNKRLGIIPTSISKPIREKLISDEEYAVMKNVGKKEDPLFMHISDISASDYTPMERKTLIKKLRTEMKTAAQDMDFELAITLRDKIKEIENY